MIRKRPAWPHYLTYMLGIALGVSVIGFAVDFSHTGGVWHILAAMGLVTFAIGVLEHGILSWYEYSQNMWSYHCQICHVIPNAKCEITGNDKDFIERLADKHMEDTHPYTLDNGT